MRIHDLKSLVRRIVCTLLCTTYYSTVAIESVVKDDLNPSQLFCGFSDVNSIKIRFIAFLGIGFPFPIFFFLFIHLCPQKTSSRSLHFQCSFLAKKNHLCFKFLYILLHLHDVPIWKLRISIYRYFALRYGQWKWWWWITKMTTESNRFKTFLEVCIRFSVCKETTFSPIILKIIFIQLKANKIWNVYRWKALELE